VTDGPALRIAIDRNNNGVIDDGDVPMGGVVDLPVNGTLPVIVEWKSTYEFQTVASLDLYVGVENDTTDATLVYAPVGHGIHAEQTATGDLDPNVYVDPSGGAHRRLRDSYMADPTGLLHIVPTAADNVVGGTPIWGRRVVRLRASDFAVGRVRAQPGEPREPVCRWNVWCRKPGFADRCEEVCTTPPPAPTTYHFDAPAAPTRLYVRAFARTQTLGPSTCTGTDAASIKAQRRGQCIERLAFSNPVWAKRSSFDTVAPWPIVVAQ
jgi:hypothetical protein